jgi:hypothetical protein
MNARFTMLFKSKAERERYIQMANAQDKSLGKLVRELLQAEYAKLNPKTEVAA